jgi:hypothetical protein
MDQVSIVGSLLSAPTGDVLEVLYISTSDYSGKCDTCVSICCVASSRQGSAAGFSGLVGMY